MTSDRDRTDRALTGRGALNLRDLGGLPTVDGRVVRRGRVYRSEYPRFVTKDGDMVRRLGLRTVVDLRRRSEVEFECVRWADHGVDHVVCSLSAGVTSSWHAAYEAYLERRPDRVVSAVRRVLSAAGHPVLFHCAAGKDRTGVLAALLLSVLGVAEEAIVADYVLTELALAAMLERLRSSQPYAAMLAASSNEEQRPRPETMRTFLDWLAGLGGAEGWMLVNGVPGQEIEDFRRSLLDT